TAHLGRAAEQLALDEVVSRLRGAAFLGVRRGGPGGDLVVAQLVRIFVAAPASGPLTPVDPLSLQPAVVEAEDTVHLGGDAFVVGGDEGRAALAANKL